MQFKLEAASHYNWQPETIERWQRDYPALKNYSMTQHGEHFYIEVVHLRDLVDLSAALGNHLIIKANEEYYINGRLVPINTLVIYDSWIE